MPFLLWRVQDQKCQQWHFPWMQHGFPWTVSQLAAEEKVFPRLLIDARWQKHRTTSVVDLWKQARVLFHLELMGLGWASGPKAAVPQARNLRSAAEAALRSAWSQTALATTTEIALHFTTYPRKVPGLSPQQEAKGHNKGWGALQGLPRRQGDRSYPWQLLPLNLAIQGRGEVTQIPARDWKA